jgi:hypothetical protein
MKMTLTEHWKRAWEAPRYIDTREELVREEKKWIDAKQEFCDVVGPYAQSGGKVINRRVSNFLIIAGLHRKELRSTIRDWDILARVNPE